MKIKAKSWISAAHFVQTTPDSICSGIHGHNWKIIVEIESPLLNGSGMVLDKHDIDNIIDQLDHKLIVPNNLIESQEDEYCNIINNDKEYRIPVSDVISVPIEAVTSELVAQMIKAKLHEIVIPSTSKIKVTVEESRNLSATAE